MPSEIKIFNQDCIEAMKEMPDKAFDLAIVDPPYGIGEITRSNSRLHKKCTWNKEIPSKKYFQELHRVSVHQVIWGVNYYVGIKFPVGRFIHDKIAMNQVQMDNYSEADIASQSFNRLIKVFKHTWKGNVQGNSINWKNNGSDGRIHPCQKPVGLYKWILREYAPPQTKILDTHLGSGSIAIACYDMGFDLTGFEIDKDYYDAAVKRLENHKRQLTFI